MFSCISWNMRILIIFVLINLCLAYNELMTFYLIFAVYYIHCTWLYILDRGFPLWQCFCVAAKIFVYLGLCNIMFYFDYFIFSKLHYLRHSYKWNKIQSISLYLCFVWYSLTISSRIFLVCNLQIHIEKPTCVYVYFLINK